jgi:hypothetical protein
MICLLALVVFGILGIFSATHRKIAVEAFDCVFRRLTIRKCTSGLDKRLKSQITGKLMRKSPRLAKFTYGNFEAISWVFTALMVLSLVYTGIGAYNYVVYDNCNGAHSDEFCIFNPADSGKASCGSSFCEENGCECGEMESLCTVENDFAACDGNCDCNQDVCGVGLE